MGDDPQLVLVVENLQKILPDIILLPNQVSFMHGFVFCKVLKQAITIENTLDNSQVSNGPVLHELAFALVGSLKQHLER